jgi:uracil-DNA glycosylase
VPRGYADDVPARSRTARPDELQDAYRPAEDLIPPRPSIPKLSRAAADCRACGLWKTGTQTVFGVGPASARLMLVGEQPGDREDIEGEPFVGPAGAVLARALSDAGIAQRDAYVTNVVKHFKWTQGRGKRRLHQRPNAEEIGACRPWLESELEVVRPDVVACLGATAAKALLGSKVRVTRDRGQFMEADFAPAVTVTVHPSSILRIDDEEERQQARVEFTSDLRKIARRLDS